MKLSINQALPEAIAAHKLGNVKEAAQLYKAILKKQPSHPDANHNLGVLEVSYGRLQEALPFFEAALQANKNLSQFWLSYIQVLIRLGRLTDAKTALDLAKGKGLDADTVDNIEKNRRSKTETKNR